MIVRKMVVGFLIGFLPMLLVSPANAKDQADPRSIELCKNNDADACFYAFKLNYNMFLQNNSLMDAARYAARACDIGHPEACFYAGMIYYPNNFIDDGLFDVDYDLDDSLRFFQKDCDANLPIVSNGCNYLSLSFFDGEYSGITLEQAYAYGISGCKEKLADNCYSLYFSYDKISTLPNVASKFSLFIMAKSADFDLIMDWPKPPEKWAD